MSSSPIVADLLKQLDLKPQVYLGGKIRQNCWRHKLVKDLRGHHWNDGPLQQVNFDYVGPFFVCCDHGCYHHPSTHGNGYGCSPSFDISRKTVAKLCRKAVDGCDLLFCYIDAPDCYGTIAEIERAHVRGIRVVIVFAPGIASIWKNDFWFICVNAHKVHVNIKEHQLIALFSQTLKDMP